MNLSEYLSIFLAFLSLYLVYNIHIRQKNYKNYEKKINDCIKKISRIDSKIECLNNESYSFFEDMNYQLSTLFDSSIRIVENIGINNREKILINNLVNAKHNCVHSFRRKELHSNDMCKQTKSLNFYLERGSVPKETCLLVKMLIEYNKINKEVVDLAIKVLSKCEEQSNNKSYTGNFTRYTK